MKKQSKMTPTEKLSRVVALVQELQGETHDAIVEARIAGLAKALQVSPFQCGLIYWMLKAAPEFRRMFGTDVKVRVRPK